MKTNNKKRTLTRLSGLLPLRFSSLREFSAYSLRCLLLRSCLAFCCLFYDTLIRTRHTPAHLVWRKGGRYVDRKSSVRCIPCLILCITGSRKNHPQNTDPSLAFGMKEFTNLLIPVVVGINRKERCKICI